MRIKTPFFAVFIFLIARSLACGVDVEIERLHDPLVYLCPRCHKVIRTGDIQGNAELMLADALKTSLSVRNIEYAEGKGSDKMRLSILVYRFQERRGSTMAVDRPASVGFHSHLYRDNILIKTVVFDETQQPLSENVLKLSTFLRRGAKWITVDQLGREGIEKVVSELEKDLEENK